MVRNGYINRLYKLPIAKYDKFARAISYIPRSFAWIDPLKEMQSNIIGLQNGTVTYADISAAMVEMLKNYLNNIRKRLS